MTGRLRSGPWHRGLAWLLRNFYFRVRVVGASPVSRPGQVILCSHRNGAIDGYLLLAAFPDAKFLVSVQLLRNPLLRLMFGGIPVARDKDVARYGVSKQQFPNPIAAGMACLQAGGCLAIFPEGSSEWGPHPLPYEPGAARIVRMALAEGLAVEVVPVGLFYDAPDRFRSRAEVLVGEAIALPARGDDDKRAWEARIRAALNQGLDAVSVNCPDAASFADVETLARTDAGRGDSYALAFKAHETKARAGEALAVAAAAVDPPAAAPRRFWNWPCSAAFVVLLAPVLALAGWAGSKADGRNTTSFFRLAGGFAAALLWLPTLALLFYLHPLVLAPVGLLAGIGWWRWGRA